MPWWLWVAVCGSAAVSLYCAIWFYRRVIRLENELIVARQMLANSEHNWRGTYEIEKENHHRTRARLKACEQERDA